VRGAEARSLGVLAGRLAGDMTCRLEEFHLAIADRSFRHAGPGARPVRVIHDSVASAVYGGLRRAGGATAARVARRPPGEASRVRPRWVTLRAAPWRSPR